MFNREKLSGACEHTMISIIQHTVPTKSFSEAHPSYDSTVLRVVANIFNSFLTSRVCHRLGVHSQEGIYFD